MHTARLFIGFAMDHHGSRYSLTRFPLCWMDSQHRCQVKGGLVQKRAPKFSLETLYRISLYSVFTGGDGLLDGLCLEALQKVNSAF